MMKRCGNSGPTSVTKSSKDWNATLERVGKDQDKAAFSELFAHYAPLLKAFLLNGGGLDAARAEELVQESMIKVWRKAPTFSAKQASASTWLYTIARNTRIDWLRKQGNRISSEELDADQLYDETEANNPHANLVHLRNQKNIREQLKNLPQDQRQVLTMMYFQAKSGSEIANELDMPLGTVKSRLRLALQKLKLRVDTEVTSP